MKIQNGYTKGPWEISTYTNYLGWSIYAGGGCIAERWYDTDRTDEQNGEMRANSRLIAAAPELLEALEEAEKFVDRHSESWYTTGQELLAKMRAAIAKAEGK